MFHELLYQIRLEVKPIQNNWKHCLGHAFIIFILCPNILRYAFTTFILYPNIGYTHSKTYGQTLGGCQRDNLEDMSINCCSTDHSCWVMFHNFLRILYGFLDKNQFIGWPLSVCQLQVSITLHFYSVTVLSDALPKLILSLEAGCSIDYAIYIMSGKGHNHAETTCPHHC